ncbi:sensor histidine kinase [Pseudorhodoferax soli]|uniref:C4-dicarboxylate transport sensor protein DctB n=1 Tax=Pseudorhodoferax soli TaxID=545864 RepID=A0A368XR33_9BURK|nr:ATP-binding protein [Pseudorhodoferax soli]RCW70402.1 two-component system C4-dicarboxylate transport sensor histidine kinase DctB [Pseudorhodoferax soli]
MADSPAQPERAQRLTARLAARSATAALLIGLAAWAGSWLAMHQGLAALEQVAAQRLEVAAARLDAQLARFDFLPSLLETSPEVMQFFAHPADGQRAYGVNLYLQSLNAIAGSDNLYLVDRGGTAIAAADFALPGTPYGRDLSYRPYVRDALASGRGHFYGLGVTTARAGYYLSYALPSQGTALGLATVKVDLAGMEQEWRQLPGPVLVVDEHQVAILSSRDDWRWRPLVALTEEARAEAAAARRYGPSSLEPLGWRDRAEGDGQARRTQSEGQASGAQSDGQARGTHSDGQARRVRVDGRPWLASTRQVHQGRWQLILLDDEAAVRASARNWAFSAALAMALLLAAGALLGARRRAVRQHLASRAALQRAHDALERKVAERTAALQAAQDELVHAGKLAVLGQLSAGLVHELNQPLAALQTVSDNADQLIQRNRLDEARDNLARIGRLVGRLKRLSSQLRLFASKPADIVGSVELLRLVQELQQQLAPRLQEGGIVLSLEGLPATLAVAGDESRMEQVLANLLGNAIDALQGWPGARRIDVAATVAGGRARVAIRNNGPLIPDTILARMFQPFITTKPAGKGMGLGLMVSAHLVREFGGTLSAHNLAPTGAEFVIDLPLRRADAP